jgi:N-acetylmuramoyl-L-alanine amidase
VRAFQQARGLLDSGTCDEATWGALVEAGWRLGDRHLYLRRPYLRGDDVAELQARVSRLGFDPGRVDGIFGPTTSAAVSEFQRNVGLTPDGVVGHETYRALQRLAAKASSGPLVSEVRESLRLGAAVPRPRIVVGQSGALAPLARSVTRQLRSWGCRVLAADDVDPRVNARLANSFDAHAYLGLANDAAEPWVAYYEVPGFSSIGGRRLAELAAGVLTGTELAAGCVVRGMRLPILRETRMPAIEVELGADGTRPEHQPAVAAGLARAVAQWCALPVVPVAPGTTT